jgi:cytochrome c553
VYNDACGGTSERQCWVLRRLEVALMNHGKRRLPGRAWAAAILVLGSTSAVIAGDRGASLTAGLAWAYPSGPQTTYGQAPGPGPFHMPGSKLTLTRAQLDQAEGPIDWHPEEHPPAPAIVRGPATSKTTPCAECHAFNGAGFPASADLAGLPAAYIIEQVMAFRSGDRQSARPDQPNTAEMIKAAKSVTHEELNAAAAYFSRLPRKSWLRIIETATVPRTSPDKFGWLNLAPGGGHDPIGNRIIELSDDMQRQFLYDDHVFLRDYVPPGAVQRGKRVVTTGGGTGTPCSSCHGPGLRGTALAPPLAGRPAGYIARTLWDIRVGARRGASVALMQVPARAMRPTEIRDAAAYLASLKR